MRGGDFKADGIREGMAHSLQLVSSSMEVPPGWLFASIDAMRSVIPAPACCAEITDIPVTDDIVTDAST